MCPTIFTIACQLSLVCVVLKTRPKFDLMSLCTNIRAWFCKDKKMNRRYEKKLYTCLKVLHSARSVAMYHFLKKGLRKFFDQLCLKNNCNQCYNLTLKT